MECYNSVKDIIMMCVEYVVKFLKLCTNIRFEKLLCLQILLFYGFLMVRLKNKRCISDKLCSDLVLFTSVKITLGETNLC